MGEAAEMMLDGTCCQVCGEFLLNDDPAGYPVTCAGCGGDDGLSQMGNGEGKKRRKKRQRQRQNRKRRERLSEELKENGSLWWFLSDHHWRRIIKDVSLDYWPSTGVFSYKGKIHKGEDVYKFIKEAESC